MSNSPFGKARYGGNNLKWFKLKDGTSTFRILPPMGDLAEEGRWSQFSSNHYGYKNSKGKTRVFQSPLVKNQKTKMIEVPDAALEKIELYTAKLKEAREAKNEELVKKLLEYVGGPKSQYNLDNNHYMNVIDLQGNIGILKIRHKCKLALDAEIKKLREQGIDPLDPSTGRFFDFNRTGMARDTVYSVTVHKKKFHVEGVGEVEQPVTHVITDEIAKRCVVLKNGRWEYREAGNLSTLFKKPTAEEVKRIVNEGAKAVDEILDGGSEESSVSEGGDEGPEEEAAQTAAPAPTASTEPAVQAQEEPTTTTSIEKSTPNQYVEAPKTTAQAVTEQTEEEFLKSIGL